MRIFSLPVLGLGAAIVIGGGIIYALSGSSHRHDVVAVAQPAVPSVGGSGSSAGSAPSPDSSMPAPAPVVDSAPAAAAPATPTDNAPATNGNGRRHGGGGQRLFSQLGLSADQQKQIQQIRSTITDRQQRRDAIMKVLTPDQQAKLQQLRAQMRGQRSGGGQGTPKANQ